MTAATQSAAAQSAWANGMYTGLAIGFLNGAALAVIFLL